MASISVRSTSRDSSVETLDLYGVQHDFLIFSAVHSVHYTQFEWRKKHDNDQAENLTRLRFSIPRDRVGISNSRPCVPHGVV